jgi:hypothetical protein
MSATRTPGTLYVLWRIYDVIQVVPVPRDQGEAMRRRSEKYVFNSSAQAHAVRQKLEAAEERNE